VRLVFIDEFAVDQNVLDPGWRLSGIEEIQIIRYRLQIEDDDIGKGARLQDTSVLQAEP
jgi:hypothetical protein